MNKKPYSDRRWHDADFETVMNLKPLKHSEEYKKMQRNFSAGCLAENSRMKTCQKN